MALHLKMSPKAAGVDDGGYGMGVAVGDYDNDGDTDLYVTNVGPNKLFRNDGAGHFEEVAEAAGVSDDGWGTSAAFVDFDGDGLLDLYVVNYIYWTPAQEIECTAGGAGRDYCHPNNYRSPASDVLYRNIGGGRFEDVSTTSGIGLAKANGLGITTADFTGDGLVDFYIANDGDQNQLWVNNGDGTFTDRGLVMGAAVNRQGSTEAGMGVATFDLENDGDLDLMVTHLRDETNTLYRNDGGVFQDITASAGLAGPSIPFTGFGVGVADFDHDTLMDLYVVNGRVGLAGASAESDPFAEPNQLYRGVGLGLFEEISQSFENTLKSTSRAAALGDYDNDGDLDVVVLNNGGRVHLLRNEKADKGNWIAFHVDEPDGSPAIGSILSIYAGSRVLYRSVGRAGSYQASHDPRIHVGLGSSTVVDSVIIIGPAGQHARFGPFEAGAYHPLIVF